MSDKRRGEKGGTGERGKVFPEEALPESEANVSVFFVSKPRAAFEYNRKQGIVQREALFGIRQGLSSLLSKQSLADLTSK